MRFFGLGLLLVACGGTSAEFSSLTNAGGAAGEDGIGSGGSSIESPGVAGSVSTAAGAGSAGAVSRGGAGGIHADNGGSASAGSSSAGAGSSGGKGGAAAGGGAGAFSAGAGGMSAAGASSGAAGTTASAGAGGAACVARKACASAGVIVDNCIPCDEQHCGTYSDGCTGTVDCGACNGSGEFCSSVHVCKSLTADCSEYQGLKGSICLKVPSGGTTQTFWCPVAPQTSACVWSAADSCWKCNGA